jgi:hypothetical protein
MKKQKLLTLLAVTMAFIVLAASANAVTVVREIMVEDYDAEEAINSTVLGGTTQGKVDIGSSDLEIGSESGSNLEWQACGVQYNMLGIPQGSTIISAKLTFQCKGTGHTYAGASNDFRIIAEAIDDAAAFTTTDFDITSRDRTSATAAWNPPYPTSGGDIVDTPDLKSLIQEVVGRTGWSDDNRLTLMIFPQIHLDLADPSTGGTTPLQELNVHAGAGSDSATLTVEYIPEPATMCLLGLGGLMLRRRKKA